MARQPARRRKRTDTARLLTRADARRAGISMRELCGPAYQRLFYNLYVSATVRVTPMLRARAALQVSPADSYVSHHTAGEIWGGWLPTHDSTHVSSPPTQSRCQRRGIRNHDVKPAAHVVIRHGVPVTDPAQTFLDLATELNLVDLVVFGDSLVAAGRVSPELLVERADAWTGKGRRLARRAARLVRPGVDSPMESRLRMLIVLAGLPEPRVNVVLRHEDGSWRMRFDLSYPTFKLIIEYDGRQHAENDAQWRRDLERREELDQMGWRLLVVQSGGVYVEPETTLRRVAAALRDRGCTSVPRRFREEWRRYFPGQDGRQR